MTGLVRAGMQGDFAKCRELHRRYVALMDVLFVESNPGPVKAAMASLGLLRPVYRLPLVPPSGQNRERIDRTLQEAGVRS
jgi:4-hydroxy-tetrahydrodipicolinate synthase